MTRVKEVQMIGRVLGALVLFALTAGSLSAQAVPTPLSHFGFEIGSDRSLADWLALTSYYEELARTSDRIAIDTLGQSTMGLPFVMLTVTSAANHQRLDELHQIQMKLSDPRLVSGEAELARLLEDGRAVVLITHGIHATEVGGPQMAARLMYRLATSDAPEVRQVLDNVIFLDIPSLNPDGLQWIVDWYNQWVGTEYEGSPLPWLYHFYTGHDNNRDWYAFTQQETQLTVMGAHNAWHPHIVHDIHQMGNTGARIFFPPYIDPVERNVDPLLISSINQLGAYMAAELYSQGKKGIVINAQYDLFTPARAYMHYHGGARILSETASARIATPVDVPPERLAGRRGFDATSSTWNFPDPWEGGEWGLPDIVDYMEAGAFALLSNAAKNRSFWVRNFYRINERAVEGWDSWPEAWVLPAGQANETGLAFALRILTMGDVEVHRAGASFSVGGRSFPAGSYVIPLQQPYASFAQTMLEVQEYPDMREYPGGPPLRPYDVTAHTLPLLMDFDAVPVDESVSVDLSDPIDIPDFHFSLPEALEGDNAPRIGMYKSWREPMPEGWTRWVFDQYGLRYDTIHDARVRAGSLRDDYDVIVLQAQDAESILRGFNEGQVPPEYTGGVGDAGAAALGQFVRNGGRLVAIEDATEFVIDLFDLAVSNAVERLPSQDFYIPGSILHLELEEGHALAVGLGSSTSAWYWRSSRAFEVSDPSLEVVARYGEGDPLLSGWVLGPEHVAGKPAIVQGQIGQGSVVLFGFQPNYRAQTVATWPLLFNAMSVER